MFAALQLCRAFVIGERIRNPDCASRGYQSRPREADQDINGALNAIGERINAGKGYDFARRIGSRVASFTRVSRLSDDTRLFIKGIEKDKQVRGYVYHLCSPA